MFYFVGIIITFFLALLLISKKNKSTPDWILAVWLTVVGIHLSLFYLFISGKYMEFPYFLGIDRPVPLLHGPFLYLYIAHATRQVKGKYSLLHFLPWAVALAYLMPFIFLPVSEKIYVYQHEGAGYETISAIIVWAITVSGVVYVALSMRLLWRHQRNIEQEFSDTDNISLAWLRYMIFGMGVIWVMVIYGDDPLIFGTVVVFVFFLGYFGIRQVGIFTHQPITQVPSEEEQEPKSSPQELAETPEVKKYQKSGLNEEAALEIHRKLSETMQQEMLFKNPELTLPELSQKLEINPNTLSQVINSREGKSFYDYINSLRIEDFKKMALQPENQKYSLLGLALQCGFNSKTSFHRNFKKATRLSPSEYLRQNNIRLE